MDPNVMRKLFPMQMDRKDAGACPTCGGKVGPFKDALSKREFGISGMCQACQDGFFTEED